jgi:DNA-binding transcriptional LysR family regulator
LHHRSLRLTRIAPGIVVRLIDSRAPIEELLEAGEADLAVEVMHELPDRVHSHFLFEKKYVVIAGADPSLRRDRAATEVNQVFDLEPYCRLPHVLHSLTGGVSGNVDAALAAIGRRRNVALSLPHFFTIAQAVAKSGLIATFPERLTRRLAPILGLRIFLPPIELAPISLVMIWHRRNDNDAGHLWLRQQVMSVAQGTGPR